jgi:hypothetical protein
MATVETITPAVLEDSAAPSDSNGLSTLEQLDILEELTCIQAKIDSPTSDLAKEDPAAPEVIALTVKQALRYMEAVGGDGRFNILWAEFGLAMQEGTELSRAIQIFNAGSKADSELTSAAGFGMIAGMVYASLIGFSVPPTSAPKN